MTLVINFSLVIVSFLMMEIIAWSSHKYLMHGILWFMHKDHHRRDPNKSWEFNDLFFVIFATPGILLIYLGYTQSINSPLFWIGVGISVYGLAYVFVHDVAVHQRLRIFTRIDSIYFRAIRKAHKIHHKHLGKDHGENFGFLWVAKKYLDESRKIKDR